VKRLVPSLVAALAMPAALAQPLTLFEPTESNAAQQPAQQGPAPAPGFGGGSQPAFTLRSTSRVGDDYHVVLVNRDGSVAKVQWQPGAQASVPQHPGFAITEVAGRSVTLEYPGSEPCSSVPDKGVSCSADNQALLSLARSTPLAPSPQQGVPAGQGPGAMDDPFAAAAAQAAANGGAPQPATLNASVQGQRRIINPFSGEVEMVPVQGQGTPDQARAERQQQRAERLRNFVPPRIEDADVPPGMRKVSTPFGDRLVPIRE